MQSSSGSWSVVALCGLASLTLGFTFVPDLPENQGVSSDALVALRDYSTAFAANTGLLVLRNDRVLLEHYTGTSTASSRFNLTSATKSFGAGMLVRAIDAGLVSLADPLCGVPGLTLRHAASMSGGFPKGSNSTCGSTMVFDPGEDWLYSDGSANAVRDRLREVYGQDLEPHLELILNTIGVENWRWEDRQRFSSGLDMTTRDMVRYGRLWQRGGDWDGVQLLRADLVAQAGEPANPGLKEDYGLLWWVKHDTTPAPYDRYGFHLHPMFPDSAPSDSLLALGCTRAFILVVASLDLVVARGGGDCVVLSETPQLSDEARGFIEAALAGISVCSDGVDNDADGLTDYPADPECTLLMGSSEGSTPVVPALSGPGLGLLGAALGASAWFGLRRRRPGG